MTTSSQSNSMNTVTVNSIGTQGPPGSTGPSGTSVLNGSSAPQSSDGNNGDFFLETTNSRLYGPKAAGAWPSSYVSLVGPTGSTGSTGSAGSDGSDGQDGKTLLNGSGAPSGGNDGDFWIDTNNNRIYGPKASGSWPSGFTSIVGPQGQVGQTGSTGASGAAASISVGSVATGAEGSSATVSNSGSSSAATFDFSIPKGDKGDKGDTGNFGGATFDYTFDTSTVDSDPGTGKVRFNNSNISSATSLYIDDTDDGGTDIQSYLRTIDDSTSTIKGHFKISNKTDPNDFALFTISAATEATGYHKVTCSYVSGSTSFSASEDIVLTFARTGDKGDTGSTGSAASITVGSVSTSAPGSSATVSNSGSSGAATLDFTIPRGDVGAQGSTGGAATIAVGSTNTGSAGSNASVSNSGSSSAATFDFTIPRGDTGATGSAATVTAGTTTTSNPGTNASVTNSGSSSAATFNFTIPRGDVGATGASGSDGSDGQDGKTLLNGSGAPASGLGNDGDFYIDTNNDDLYGPKASGSWGSATSIVQGPTGPTGATGSAATIAVGTVSTGSAGSSVSISNSGSSSAATFDFTIPRGDTGATGPAGQDGVGITAGDKTDIVVSGTGNNTWTIDSDAVTNSKIADDTIAESKLDIHNAASGTNKFLGYTSNGMEWAVPPDTNTTYSVQDGELSQNNFTNTLKTKLDGVATGAEVNVKSDWNGSGDAEILNKPTLFSGDYDDLTNKPTIPTDTNTTYSISCVDGDNADEEKIRLTDSGSGTDDVVLEVGTGLSIARSGDKITFTNTVTNTDTQLSTEEVQDIIGGMVSGNTETNIAVTYDDASGKLNFVSTDTNTTYSVGDNGLTKNNFTDALKNKLDGVETGSTADMTGSEIKTAYEGESNTNAFTDAEKTKLSGIATSANNYAISADLLDEDNMATNSATKVPSQQSVKAYVDANSSDTTYTAGTGLQLSGTQFSVTSLALTTVQEASSQSAQLALTTQEGDIVVRTDENKSYVRNSGSAGSMADFTLLRTPTDAVLSVNGNTGAISAAQIAAAVEAASDSNIFTNADHSKLNAIESSATADMTGGEIKTAYEAESNTNAFTDAEKSKLAAIEASATGDQTNAEIRAAVEAATDSNVFTDADHTKLDGISTSANNYSISSDLLDEDNMASNSSSKVASQQSIKAYVDANTGTTDLSYTASSRELASSTGTNVTLPEVTTSNAGLLSASDKSKLDGIASGAGVFTRSDWNATSGDAIIYNKPTIIELVDEDNMSSDSSTKAPSQQSVKAFASNADNLGSGTVPIGRLGSSGTASSSTFLRGDNSWQTVSGTTINNNANNRLITGSGTANTLEAESNLTFDGTNLDLGDNKYIRLGNGGDLTIYHSTFDYINSTNGLYLTANFSDNMLVATPTNVKLYSNQSEKLQAHNTGVTITGTCTATSFSGNGSNLTNISATDSTKLSLGGGTLTGDLTINNSGSHKIYIRGHDNPVIIDVFNASGSQIYYQNYYNNQMWFWQSNNRGLRLPAGSSDDYEVYTSSNNWATLLTDLNVGSGGKLSSKNVYVNEIHGSGANLTNIPAPSSFNSDVTFNGDSYDVVWDKSDNRLEFGDNAALSFGAEPDLKIWSDGANTYISDEGAGGSMNVRSNASATFMYWPGNWQNHMGVNCNNTGVHLWHGLSTKLSTLSTGITITGACTASSFVTSSDQRDKADVTNFTHGLKWVEQLNPVTYRWDRRDSYVEYDENRNIKSQGTPDGSKKESAQQLGFLAQDFLAIEQADGFANDKDDMLVVNQNEDGNYGIKYQHLIPVLVNAVKELSEKVKVLEAKLA